MSGTQTAEDSLIAHTDTAGGRPAASTEHVALTRRERRMSSVAVPASRRAARRVSARHPLRGTAVFGAVAALVVTVSIPAFAAAHSDDRARTVQQVAAADAQSLVMASVDEPAALGRSSYSATTPGELREKKAEDAAAARARAAAAAAARAASVPQSTPTATDTSAVFLDAGAGAIRWPLAGVRTVSDFFLARGGEHQGVDFPAPGGTPVQAAVSGTVSVSSESYYGYGVGIVVDSVVNGTAITTVYGHMRYGSRRVVAGQHVQVGQVIGSVGDTGHSFGTHLHFEVHRNGTPIDPLPWLRANAG